ncbi:hypothetical protein ACI65C_013588 [Semiaphis heraclei]
MSEPEVEVTLVDEDSGIEYTCMMTAEEIDRGNSVSNIASETISSEPPRKKLKQIPTVDKVVLAIQQNKTIDEENRERRHREKMEQKKEALDLLSRLVTALEKRLKALPNNADKIVMTTCIIHNFIKKDTNEIIHNSNRNEISESTISTNLHSLTKQGEMLIELVRSRPSLYDMSNKKYSDHLHKELMWREIAGALDQPAQICKKTWIGLRDAYRRSSKKLITVSGQKSKFIRKWKFSDEMEFLKKHMKERETISSVKRVSDDDTELSNSNNEKTRSEYMSENSDGSIEVGQEVIEPLSNKSVKTSTPSTKQLFPKKKF